MNITRTWKKLEMEKGLLTNQHKLIDGHRGSFLELGTV